MIQAVAYFRKSNEDEGESIAQQREWAVRAARENGIELVAEFADAAKAGWDTVNRTEFGKMIQFVSANARKSPIEAVVCWHPNRFSRADSLETFSFLQKLREAGCSKMFIYPNAWKDFNRSEDRIIFGVEQEAGSHRFVRDLSAAVLRGRLAGARKGRYVGSKPPFGYLTTPDKKLTPHPTEAAVVARLFTAYAAGTESLRGLCRALEADGVLSPTGKSLWAAETLSRILDNPVYTGDLVFNRRSEGKIVRNGKKPTKNAPEQWVRVADAHPALTSREQFEAVQARFRLNKGRTTPNAAHTFLLTGLAFCGNCGHRMIGRTMRSTHSGTAFVHQYFVCQRYNAYGLRSGCTLNAVPEKDIVPAVVRRVAEVFQSPESLAAVVARVDEVGAEERTTGTHRAKELATKLADLDAKIKRGAERLLSVDDDLFEACKDQLTRWKDERAALKAELDAAGLAQAGERDAGRTAEAVRRSVAHLADVLQTASRADLRLLFAELIDRIDLNFAVADPTAKRKSSRFVGGTIKMRAPASPYLSPGPKSCYCRA
ncbi:recombinase family protein [Limnoglobus roseus]|uniref:Recombinase family protein n=1 Tax=Limnoglobus roseus TaxID=2598579 RepID=A0A5C1AFI3_9BACT|nr:recombinase family protein [Limnoglobus roseus]QEL15904.1 recombinase family protein [Limnoglobus roseus]